MKKIKYHIKSLILTICLPCLMKLFSCGASQQQQGSEEGAYQGPPFSYNLESPTTIKLPKELEEISGITATKAGELACVQDEEGKIYWIDVNSGDIKRKEKFAKDGDFEDLALVGDVLYVLRSDGRLYKTPPPYDDGDKIETELQSRNDTEGLCYVPDQNLLLIACKAWSGIEVDIDDTRSIYAFDLSTNKLRTQPYLVIDLAQLSDLAGQQVPFEPSGIAQHPISKDFYIISSVGKLLIVLNKQGQITHVQSLDRKGFKQPEGICFTPNGTMYISNEGKGGKANIMSYSYQP